MSNNYNNQNNSGVSEVTETITFEKLFSTGQLRKTWVKLRKELRKMTARDVVDWADWANTIESSLDLIIREIINGTYRPSSFTRFEAGKSKGAYRVLTLLNIKDELIYRHICDFAYQRALPDEVKGAYFSMRHAATPIGRTFLPDQDPYYRFFQIWLHYNEYRTRTLLNQPYRILVVSDISNYFESIQHGLLFEYLAPLGIPRKAIGLLGQLLEAFRPESGHSPSPHVGIPVVQSDSSRELAHLFLFEHDKRIVNEFGEENYVRWMDDQNIGVNSGAEAKKVVNHLTRSLSLQRLTINSGKTKFLDPKEVSVQFHLDPNEEITNWNERLRKQQNKLTPDLRKDFVNLCRKIYNSKHSYTGHWDKILKRLYAGATRVNTNILEKNSIHDLINYPYLGERIFRYYSRRNRGTKLLSLFNTYMRERENLYEETELQFFESLMFLNSSRTLSKEIIRLASEFAHGNLRNQTNRPLGRSAAITVLYWFGENMRNLRDLFTENDAKDLPKEVARSWLACAVALSPDCFSVLVNKLFGHPSDDLLRLVRFIEGILSGKVESLGNYKSKKSRWPMPGRYYDPRAWLLLDLASCGKSNNLKIAVENDYNSFTKYIYTNSEERVANRVATRANIQNRQF